MTKRQQRRFHDLIDRYHLGGQHYRLPGYDQYEDGSHTETEILLDDKDCDMAASEFRCCGFVVTTERMDGAA
jgi:hypothetical protein